MAEPELLEFVWLPTFERTSKKLLTDVDRRALEAMLCLDQEAGALIRRTHGFRKLRFAAAGGGKRGGLRVVYFPDAECGRVYMILVYTKGAKDTLTREEEKELRRLALELKREDC